MVLRIPRNCFLQPRKSAGSSGEGWPAELWKRSYICPDMGAFGTSAAFPGRNSNPSEGLSYCSRDKT